MKVRKLIVFDGKMGMRKFWSVALPFGRVAYMVLVIVKLPKLPNIVKIYPVFYILVLRLTTPILDALPR